jgi:hypothetical protein
MFPRAGRLLRRRLPTEPKPWHSHAAQPIALITLRACSSYAPSPRGSIIHTVIL